jgi:hypothetical protein
VDGGGERDFEFGRDDHEGVNIHPLIREEVAIIVKRLQETAAEEQKTARKPKAAKKRK